MMPEPLIVALSLFLASLVYATVGQAGGTAFLAVMAVAGMAPDELRPTALALNVVAAAWSTWRLHAAQRIDWRMLAALGLASLPASFAGGLVALDDGVYVVLTGAIVIFAAAMMFTRWTERPTKPPPGAVPCALIGTGVGFVSGLTGVGGGVFLAPMLIGLRWTTARAAAALSAPFILGNSAAALVGTLLAGQKVSGDIGSFAVAALAGALVGTMVGHRFMSERATRYVLAAVLLVAGVRLLTR